ncbi:hypothetical protein L6452_30910 [Arctium lappa]|uniref:Uncharacterized protein n=1 Tax=Arctium lappa TaxID=4217 RepID=A0ACB8ZJL6_ARCLA|nr:hypothetical protein L6452_30910 [Arctium lappa]
MAKATLVSDDLRTQPSIDIDTGSLKSLLDDPIIARISRHYLNLSSLESLLLVFLSASIARTVSGVNINYPSLGGSTTHTSPNNNGTIDLQRFMADIRAAIPKHCWVKDPWRSTRYVLRDVVVVFGLAAVVAYFNNMVV